MTVTHVVVVSDHESPERAPIEIKAGDRVDVGERDTTWPAFVLIATESGSGWVPERHLDGNRPTATVLHPYDTRELTVKVGDRLTLIEDDPVAGWSWCRNAAGETGWVPHSVLHPASPGVSRRPESER